MSDIIEITQIEYPVTVTAPGPQGTPGPAGPPGATGGVGPQGDVGPQGAAGANGTNGTNGSNGQGVPTGGTTNQILAKTSNADFATAWVTPGAGSGTVTSVALTAPGIFAVGGSPITAAGTLALTLATQTANIVWAGPTSGGAATPTFRALVAADLPVHSAALITTGLLALARGGTNTDLSATGGSSQFLKQKTAGGAIAVEVIKAGDLPVMVASGASHAGGVVPDPGSTAGSNRYLREDATWANPPLPTITSFNFNVVPTGTVNGVNAAFDVGTTPDIGTLRVYKNGLRQTPTTDYTLSGSVVTFVAGNIPQTGDLLLCDFHGLSS